MKILCTLFSYAITVKDFHFSCEKREGKISLLKIFVGEEKEK